MIIDGKQIADEVSDELKKEIVSKNLELSLAAVLVGDDPEFKKFVELKSKAADKVEVSPTIYTFPKNISAEELKKDLSEIIKWSDGVLVELPLPEGIDQQEILNMVPVGKDVDVLSDDAQKLFYDNKSKINPPAVEALKIVLEINDINLKGKKVAVFGQGVLIGKPISHWLEQQGAEVSRIRSTTKNPEKLSLEADIVIAGVGKPGLIKEKMIKEGTIVIDYGYGKKGGKMVGDVDFIKVAKKTSLITPVPGGMGPILITTVLKNLIKLNS
jgi:methylenetetrahydrofolate dehydrogenase (NADP+)/methenyltetrahydrofolate cyclohydrolase